MTADDPAVATYPAVIDRRYSLLNYFFDASDDAAFEHHFDTVRMSRRIGQNPLNDAFREFARALILFLNNTNLHSRPDIRSIFSVHCDI